MGYANGYRILAERTLTGITLHVCGCEYLGQNADDDECLNYLTNGTGYVRQTTDEQGQPAGTWLFTPNGAVLAGPRDR